MFADGVPSPTYCADWYMVGWPASLIVPLALTASLITLFLFVARRGQPWHSVAALFLCVGLFVAVDCVVYEIGRKHQNLRRTPNRRPEPEWLFDKKSDKVERRQESPAERKD